MSRVLASLVILALCREWIRVVVLLVRALPTPFTVHSLVLLVIIVERDNLRDLEGSALAITSTALLGAAKYHARRCKQHLHQRHAIDSMRNLVSNHRALILLGFKNFCILSILYIKYVYSNHYKVYI